MGGAKRAMEERDARYQLGLNICIEVGLISECEYHPGDYYEGNGNLEEAYRFANSRVTAGKIELANGMTRRDLTDVIKAAYEDNSGIDYCPSCEKNMRS